MKRERTGRGNRNGPAEGTAAASPPQVCAVIDIGATSIRMAVAEVDGCGRWEIRDQLQQSFSLGRDTFTSGNIGFATTETCVRILRHFLAVLRENWGVTSLAQVRAVGTSAVCEAANCGQFINRIQIATGIAIEPIAGADVNRLTYLAVQSLIAENAEFRRDNLLLIEVGGGNTEVMGLHNGLVDFSQTHRLGAFRVREILAESGDSGLDLEELLDTDISSAVRSIRDELVPGKPIRFLALGGECRFAAKRIVPSWDGRSVIKIETARLAAVAREMLGRKVEELVNELYLPLPEAETLAPALLAYVGLARELAVDTIHVGTQTLRTGLLAELVAAGEWDDTFSRQVIHSAKKLGKKYRYDERHALCVADYARQLFDVMRPVHQLPARARALLEIATILHDIGSMVSNQSHHKHTCYLMQNSGLFGLGTSDLAVASQVARYHRRATPRRAHDEFMRLSCEQQLMVVKLAAILRVADALDRAHKQHLGELELTVTDTSLVIMTAFKGSLAVEKMALESKGKMFAEVYGLSPQLRASGVKR